MSDVATFQATFHDWTSVVSRGALQLVLSAPEAQRKSVLKCLGFPAPGTSSYVSLQAEMDDGQYGSPVLAVVHKSAVPWKAIRAVKIILEIDGSQAERALQLLGMPASDETIPVLVTRITAEAAGMYRPPAEEENPDHHPAARTKHAQRSAILCGDPEFRAWLLQRAVHRDWPDDLIMDEDQLEDAAVAAHESNLDTPIDAANIIRIACAVQSRRELDTDSEAGSRWRSILQLWTDASALRFGGRP